MNALVAKIVGYENAAPDPARGALLVADTGFERQSGAVMSILPFGMTVTQQSTAAVLAMPPFTIRSSAPLTRDRG